MADNVIGRARCPVCESRRASLRVSGKQLAYLVCNTCNSQIFARSEVSDEKLRALVLTDDPAPEPTPAAPPKQVQPAAHPKQVQVPPAAPEPKAPPAAAPAAAPTPQPAPRMGWGIL